jgi:hypothetical protein
VEIKIDKNVPLKPKGSKRSYPFAEMEVNDSFFVPRDGKKITNLTAQLSSNAASYARCRDLDWKFTVRRDVEADGVRIWRIK